MFKQRRQQRGASLLELSLVMLISAVFMLVWVPVFSRPLIELDQRLTHARRVQHFYQLAGWLDGELRRTVDAGQINWQWSAATQCLLLGDELGLRLRDGHLQWRGGDRSCSDGYWSNLNESAHAYIESFVFTLNTAEPTPQAFVSVAGRVGDDLLNWQVRIDGQLSVSY
ncbi:hypothetical protein [Aliidiomarina soli]|uniref:Uncharacterized protein n=1 Tax=Aliidiomarina soli TaxID=1928574 RepID=A0A432WCW1_9GAMM|nr:hypothetical protein [Aliidiomarina soli]RUO30247.1 hypothetical protein CWE14_12780 [Aliidiomarina soli]